MDYDALGLKAGIEIHQQLNTREKLFCACPTILRKYEERTGEFFRYLRATESEMGEIDRAAQEEMKHLRQFTYYAYDTTCLVENDEEPPSPLNSEALDICLTIARIFGMTPIEQVHVMRKLVIDGSNTSGFQRTALVAVRGQIPGSGTIETICLEEEAAQRVGGNTFSLDRLGIPLVEITTSPCMHSPEEVARVAGYLGMVLRSTGRVKRGLGTIRQDINISIADGARVEIKGVQDLELVAEVVRREAARQVALLEIRDTLTARKASVQSEPLDVTEVFSGTKSAILKKASCVFAVRLNGFAGLVGCEIQPGRRLGSEFSDYAKKCNVGGVFHTDELPAYGVTEEEVEKLREFVHAGRQDCIVLVASSRKNAMCAASQVKDRAMMALEGVPEETRKMLEGGSTAYMRPLPGAARMYPETDVLPVCIDRDSWECIEVPELLTEKAQRYTRELDIDQGIAGQIVYSEYLPVFDKAISRGVSPNLTARTLLSTLKEISREGVGVEAIRDDDILTVLESVQEGSAAKEAIPDILRNLAAGSPVKVAIEKCAPSISSAELEAIIKRIVAERLDFVEQKGTGALGPLMGVVMAEVRGSADGKVVSQLLKQEIERVIKP